MSEHARVVSSRTRRLSALAVGGACVAAVVRFGELSTGALLAVGGTGLLVVAAGLARRCGDASPAIGRRAVPWLGWLVAALAWELVALLDARLPTFSDLADPILAHPPVRGAATVGWLAAGAWLLARPGRRREQP